jgi:hypothetical protein
LVDLFELYDDANFKLTTAHSRNKHRESVAFHIERKSKLQEYASRKNTNKRSDGSDTVLKQGPGRQS